MLSRWFSSRRIKRKRRMVAPARNAFRLELLEQRTCMANDLDVSPISFMVLSTPIYSQSTNPPVLATSHFSSNYVSNSSASTSLIEEECLLQVPLRRFRG